MSSEQGSTHGPRSGSILLYFLRSCLCSGGPTWAGGARTCPAGRSSTAAAASAARTAPQVSLVQPGRHRCSSAGAAPPPQLRPFALLGTFVTAACTEAGQRGTCRECDDGTYMEHANGLQQCFRCTPCRPGKPWPEAPASAAAVTTALPFLRPGSGGAVHSHPQHRVPLPTGPLLRPRAGVRAVQVVLQVSRRSGDLSRHLWSAKRPFPWRPRRCGPDEEAVRNCTPTANTQCKKVQSTGAPPAGTCLSGNATPGRLHSHNSRLA